MILAPFALIISDGNFYLPEYLLADLADRRAQRRNRSRGVEVEHGHEIFRFQIDFRFQPASAHEHIGIPASALEEAVLQNIRFNAQFLSENDEELLEKLIALGNRGQQCEMQEAKTKLNEAVKCLEIVENMAQKLFEERCTGNVPDSVFKKLMQNYDIEQANLNHVIAEKRNTLMEIENASVDISAWAEEFKQYTNIDKLNRKIVTKLIDSVEVHESTRENGVIKQHVTVNYKFVGQLSA